MTPKVCANTRARARARIAILRDLGTRRQANNQCIYSYASILTRSQPRTLWWLV